jgi:hypothetical protein
MLRLGIVLLILSVALSAGVVGLGASGVYIFAGDWGKGFGVFCEYFIWAIFVVGLGLALLGNLIRIMRKVRD